MKHGPSSLHLTRRDFLQAGAVAAGAVLVGGCRRRPYRPEDFARPGRSTVGIYAASDYRVDLADVIGRGLTDLGLDLRGKRVLLKPNLVEYEPGTVINTNSRVVVGAAVALRRAGAASVVVAEGPGHRRDLEYLTTSTGLYDHLREEKIAFVDLNHDDVRTVPLRSWFTGMTELMLPVTLLDADLVVTMPKLKTHHWAGMTCSLKNLFGVVPGAVYGWPKNLLHFKGIENSILDLAATVRPGLAIVDGIVGMEGDGPIMGTPRSVGALLMGTDPVAVDACAARVMGFVPERLPYLATAGEFLGNLDAARIDVRGDGLERFVTPFQVLDAFAGLRA
jgi:uncharacterized protein (DUF362 family)